MANVPKPQITVYFFFFSLFLFETRRASYFRTGIYIYTPTVIRFMYTPHCFFLVIIIISSAGLLAPGGVCRIYGAAASSRSDFKNRGGGGVGGGPVSKIKIISHTPSTPAMI